MFSKEVRRTNLEPFGWQVVSVLALIFSFYLVRLILLASTALDHNAYFSHVFIHRVLLTTPALLLIAVFCLSAHIRSDEIQWENLFGGTRLRNVLTIISCIIAWQFALYEYNFYFDRWHWVERFVLVVSAILVFKHPVFCFPVVLLAQSIGHQFNYPLQALSWTDKKLPFDLLLLVNSYLIVRAWVRTPRETLVYGILCLVGSFYFIPALTKLSLGETPSAWVLENDLANLFVSAYVNGWMSQVPESVILETASTIRSLNPALLVITLASELGGLFVLVHKKYTFLWLISAALLHIGIFVGSGIWFWKWVCVDLGIASLLVSLKKEEISKLYRLPMLLVSLPVIYFSSYYFAPPALGWFDSRFNNLFAMEVITKSGQAYGMNPTVFGPYNLTFVQNRFFYLVREPVLTDTFGGVYDEAMFRKLQAATLGDIAGIKRSDGMNFWNEAAVRQFARFVSRYMCALNENRGPPKLNIVAPPRHIYTKPDRDVIDYRTEFDAVRVVFREVFYDGTSIEKVSEAAVVEVGVCSAI